MVLGVLCDACRYGTGSPAEIVIGDAQVGREPPAHREVAHVAIEARLCDAADVIVVGGGDSAGQAAVYLAHNARSVHVLVRGKSLSETMSRYLIQRIEDDRDGPSVPAGAQPRAQESGQRHVGTLDRAPRRWTLALVLFTFLLALAAMIALLVTR